MSRPAPELLPGAFRAQELLGRPVLNPGGKRIGRVVELVAEGRDGELRVTGLLVGSRAWPLRFGWARKARKSLVPWDRIEGLAPCVTLRTPDNNEEEALGGVG